MTNLTITVDEQALERARMRALEEDISANAVLRVYLEYAVVRRELRKASRRIQDLARKSGMGSGVRACRSGKVIRPRDRAQPLLRAALGAQMPPFVETNVLIYAVDEEDFEKHEIASGLVEEYLVAGDGMISVQVST